MTLKDGPSDGNWAVFAEQVVQERDALRARVAEAERERDEARAEVERLGARLRDAAFNCPSCGRHDFGLFSAKIEAACGPCRAEVERLRAERRELCERVGRSVMAMYEERASYGERVYDEDVAEIARVLDEEGGGGS